MHSNPTSDRNPRLEREDLIAAQSAQRPQPALPYTVAQIFQKEPYLVRGHKAHLSPPATLTLTLTLTLALTPRSRCGSMFSP